MTQSANPVLTRTKGNSHHWTLDQIEWNLLDNSQNFGNLKTTGQLLSTAYPLKKKKWKSNITIITYPNDFIRIKK